MTGSWHPPGGGGNFVAQEGRERKTQFCTPLRQNPQKCQTVKILESVGGAEMPC